MSAAARRGARLRLVGGREGPEESAAEGREGEVLPAWQPSVPGELPPIFCEMCVRLPGREVRRPRMSSRVWQCACCGARLDLP
jgi:hypothetical protein